MSLFTRICRGWRIRSFMRLLLGTSEEIRIVVLIIVEQTRGVDIGFRRASGDVTGSTNVQESFRCGVNVIVDGGFFRAFLDDVARREDVRVFV